MPVPTPIQSAPSLQSGAPASINPFGEADPMMSIEELSVFLDIPVASIYKWRLKGTGPKGIKVGRHVRFRRSAVEKWISELEQAA